MKRKKFIAIVIVIALALSITVVALANETRQGEIEFFDGRGGNIIVDPPGETLPPEIPTDPEEGEWENLLGGGLNFWRHDIDNIENASGSEITFHSIRSLNNQQWDPSAGSSVEASYTSVIVQSQQVDFYVQVAMGGFFNGDEHVLRGHIMNLELDSTTLVEQSAGDGAAFIARVAGLEAGAGGSVGDPVNVTTPGGMPDYAWAGARYSAELEVAINDLPTEGIGVARANIVWSIVVPVTH